MTCKTCHVIHESDQGVSFLPASNDVAARVVRWAPGVEVDEPPSAFTPPRPATVAVPRASSCIACHDTSSARDPIQRCLVASEDALGDARPIVCFDEHRPEGAVTASLSKTGVCASQHTTDRDAAWEATREVLRASPVVEAPLSKGSPMVWLGAGALASMLAFAGARGLSWASERRKKQRERVASPPKPTERARLPIIDASTCLGCYACVDACPYDVLTVERYVAEVAKPDACCGLLLCEQRCPNGSLKVAEGEVVKDRPRTSDALESLDMPGVFLAGDVTGLPLIKNAILQGASVVTEIAKTISNDKRGDAIDVLVIGAGPAGISAALRAKELDLSCEVIEQGTVAASIQSFPRGKLVFDQPLDVPVVGKLWLKESTKEELLANWLRIVRKERLTIREGERMVRIEKGASGDLIVVSERAGERSDDANKETITRRAKRVVVAIGRRGTPRKLPIDIPDACISRVHYALADAKSFEGKKVVVVGLGDVAMEAAIAIARQPNTSVTIVHRGKGFTRGASRNVAEITRMQAQGALTLLFDSAIEKLDERAATVVTSGKPRAVPFDALFVLIGNIAPHATLQAAGVRTHGEVEKS